MIQHDPAFEWLFEVDVTIRPVQALAGRELGDGARTAGHGVSSCTKGVQFHHGYGEFTARDVVHNHALWCDENYPGRKDPPYRGYRNGMCAVERIEVVNDHEIVMHCKVRVPRCAVLLLERLEHAHV